MNAKHKQFENSRAIIIKYKLNVNFPCMVFSVSLYGVFSIIYRCGRNQRYNKRCKTNKQ